LLLAVRIVTNNDEIFEIKEIGRATKSPTFSGFLRAMDLGQAHPGPGRDKR